jgi:magnesium transporter
VNVAQLTNAANDALNHQDQALFRKLTANLHPNDVAKFLQNYEIAEIVSLLRCLDLRRTAKIFSFIVSFTQMQLVTVMTDKELSKLLTYLAPDKRTDVFNFLPLARQQSLLSSLTYAQREDLSRLAQYHEGTVGAVMTSEYAALSPSIMVKEAIEQLRLDALNKETIYQIYLIDEQKKIIGTLSLRELILAQPEVKLADIMWKKVIAIEVDKPKKEAIQKIADYDLLVLPVTDSLGKILGIVTYDNAMDVVEELATESFHKAGGTVSNIGFSIRDAAVSLLYRKRIFWLLLLIFFNVFSGAGIAYFEDTISQYVALVFFLPLVIGSGGNAGSQSATLIARALATGELKLRDWTYMLSKEILVALLLGITMAIAVSFLGFFRGGLQISIVVSLAMVAVVIMSSILGMCLPFILYRFKIDPATASTPLVTSIADLNGVLIYFFIATKILI